MPEKKTARIDMIFKPLIPSLLSELTKGLERISDALDQEDFETVERLAHGFKGASGNYQLHELAALFLDLEKNNKAGEIGCVREQIIYISDFIKNLSIEYSDDS